MLPTFRAGRFYHFPDSSDNTGFQPDFYAARMKDAFGKDVLHDSLSQSPRQLVLFFHNSYLDAGLDMAALSSIGHQLHPRQISGQ